MEVGLFVAAVARRELKLSFMAVLVKPVCLFDSQEGSHGCSHSDHFKKWN